MTVVRARSARNMRARNMRWRTWRGRASTARHGAGGLRKNPRLVSRLRHVHAFKRQRFRNVRRDVGWRLRAVIRVQPGAASLIGSSETACGDSDLAAPRQSKGTVDRCCLTIRFCSALVRRCVGIGPLKSQGRPAPLPLKARLARRRLANGGCSTGTLAHSFRVPASNDGAVRGQASSSIGACPALKTNDLTRTDMAGTHVPQKRRAFADTMR